MSESMSEWKHHRLKQARLDSYTIVAIPHDWIFGREEDGRFWCGREDGSVTLWVQTHALSEKRTPDSYVEDIERFIAGLPGRIEMAVQRSGATVTLYAVVDHEEDGRQIRTYRWYGFAPAEACVAHLRFTLAMPVEVVDEPANRELVEIFAAQARELAPNDFGSDELWARAAEWRKLPEASRRGARYDFHELRAISAYGFIDLLIPRRWKDGRDPDNGMWGCYRDGEDSGTLWIDFNVWRVRPGNESDLAALRRAAVQTSGAPDGARVELLKRPDGGSIVRSSYVGEERGVLLRFHRWDIYKAIPRGALLVHFSLVIPPAMQDTPDEDLLVRIIGREAEFCEFGEPPDRSRRPA